ncbi:MAG: hypothetical protein LUD50_02010 [Clostridia bacterium]|nr:hypothetical protein [Clostridia bacterium]
MFRKLALGCVVSVGMALCLCAGIIALAAGTSSSFKALADDETSEWDGSEITTVWAEDGSTVDGVTTYTISSASDLAGLASLVNSGASFSGCVINLTTNINLANYAWTPIGTATVSTSSELSIVAPFEGTFNGNGNTISNLKYSDSSGACVGLFGYISDALITGVNISNVTISAEQGIGSVVGWADDASEALNINSTISDCHVTGTVEITGNHLVGGILGCGEKTSVYDCSVDTEDGSYVTGTIEISNPTVNYGDDIGGIAGFIGVTQNTGLVSKMYNVTVNNLTVKGISKVGGILGYTTVKGTDGDPFIITTKDGGTTSVTNCTITINNSLINLGFLIFTEYNSRTYIGAVLGSAYFDMTIENCDVDGVTVYYYNSACVYQADEYNGYYGGSAYGAVITLTDCTGYATTDKV